MLHCNALWKHLGCLAPLTCGWKVHIPSLKITPLLQPALDRWWETLIWLWTRELFQPPPFPLNSTQHTRLECKAPTKYLELQCNESRPLWDTNWFRVGLCLCLSFTRYDQKKDKTQTQTLREHPQRTTPLWPLRHLTKEVRWPDQKWTSEGALWLVSRSGMSQNKSE